MSAARRAGRAAEPGLTQLNLKVGQTAGLVRWNAVIGFALGAIHTDYDLLACLRATQQSFEGIFSFALSGRCVGARMSVRPHAISERVPCLIPLPAEPKPTRPLLSSSSDLNLVTQFGMSMLSCNEVRLTYRTIASL
jgi:hypothetical protein